MEKTNKWFAGVLTTVGTGLVLWWITHQGGPLNPNKPVHLAIIAWKYSQGSSIGNLLTSPGQITIHNDGESTAENCKVYDKGDNLIGGIPFGVPPKEDVTVPVLASFLPSERTPSISLNRDGSHEYRASALVRCDKNVSSDIFATKMWLK